MGRPDPTSAGTRSPGEKRALSPFVLPTGVNPYVLLGAAIVAELFGTSALNASEGFTRPLPTLGVLVGYTVSFYLLSLVLEELPVGLVYGTWSAVGIVGITVIGVVAFDEGVDLAGVLGIGLLVAGVYVLNVVSGMSAQ
jgi:small multidrug resistance pump